MIEANRAIYRDKDKVVPIIDEGDRQAEGSGRVRHRRADQELRLVGQRRLRSASAPQWSIDNSAENGDIDKDKKPTAEQVANFALAKEAVEAAGGRVTIGNCKD